METRKGNPVWRHKVPRRMLPSDTYKPHTCAAIAKLVAPEGAKMLDQEGKYGIRWHDRYQITAHNASEPDGNGGRRYRRRTTATSRPGDERVAPPIPACLPRSMVEQARAATARSRNARGHRSIWHGDGRYVASWGAHAAPR